LKNGLIIGIAVGLVALTLVVRVAVEGRLELGKAYDAVEAGDVELAQRHFLLSARWYLPLLDVQAEAVGQLLRIGNEAMESGDFRRAVLAYDDARGALHGSAWLMIPHSDLLALADAGLAQGLAKWNEELRNAGKSGVVLGVEEARAAIERGARGGSAWWLMLMGLGFLAYVTGLGVLAWRWDDEQFRRMPWAVVGGAGFVVWVVGMILA
jgi:hypothetical protein